MYNKYDNEYMNLAKRVISEGNHRGDRTGTGTQSLFGEQMVFNMANGGFPLLTTKKLHWKSIVHELLWFLSGSTNTKYLEDNGVKIWREWQDENGDLGPVYGHNWRQFGAKPSVVKQPIPRCSSTPTYLGVANGHGGNDLSFKKTWEGMIARCYDKNSISYPQYGAKGVYVCNRWLEYKNFSDDVKNIPGFVNKETSTDTRYVLDKDLRGSGFVYSPDTCCWITDKENCTLNSNKLYTVERDGVYYTFNNISSFCEEHKIPSNNFKDCLYGKNPLVTRHGFSLIKVETINKGVDQIANLIERIKSKPEDRRLIVSAWNPAYTELMALPPCHCFFQCYVNNGALDLQMYQRSADLFLGVPFNIASYSLLLMMIAQVCGLKPGRFIHTFGDVHIYSNHREQIKEQMRREPYWEPKVTLNPEINNIFDFKFEDIQLEGYVAHPPIKAEVAV